MSTVPGTPDYGEQARPNRPNRSARRRAVAVVLAAGLAIAGAGCSPETIDRTGARPIGTGATSTTTTTTAAPTTTPPAGGSATTVGDTSTSDSTPSGPTGTGPTGSVPAESTSPGSPTPAGPPTTLPLKSSAVVTGDVAEPRTDPAPAPPALTLPKYSSTSCQEFAELGGYDRIMAVNSGEAPNDVECADLVTAADASLEVFRTTADLFTMYGVGDQATPEIGSVTNCGTDGTVDVSLKNSFGAVIVVWGVVAIVDSGGDPLDVAPFVSQVIPPNQTATVNVKFSPAQPAMADCTLITRPLLAPIADLAADAGVLTDMQASESSEDPAIWLPAIFGYEDIADDTPSVRALVDRVEDIHSPDVISAALSYGEIDDTTPTPVDNGVTPLRADSFAANYYQPDGTSGDLALVVLDSDTYPGLQPGRRLVALFRRGSDARWRYAGRVASFVPSTEGVTPPPTAPPGTTPSTVDPSGQA